MGVFGVLVCMCWWLIVIEGLVIGVIGMVLGLVLGVGLVVGVFKLVGSDFGLYGVSGLLIELLFN